MGDLYIFSSQLYIHTSELTLSFVVSFVYDAFIVLPKCVLLQAIWFFFTLRACLPQSTTKYKRIPHKGNPHGHRKDIRTIEPRFPHYQTNKLPLPLHINQLHLTIKSFFFCFQFILCVQEKGFHIKQNIFSSCEPYSYSITLQIKSVISDVHSFSSATHNHPMSL